MVNYETIASIIFFTLLTIFISTKKKNLDVKKFLSNLYFAMYRTSWGLKAMDSLANKFRKLWTYLGYLAIIVGFLGMIFIFYIIISGVFNIFAKPESAPPVGLVLPLPIQVPGIFGIKFSYWIISIFVIALVHEFSHGLIARTHKMKVKSSGFAFIGASLRLISLVIIFFSAVGKIKDSVYGCSSFFTFNFYSFSSYDFWLLVGIVLFGLSFFKSLWVPIIPVAFVEPDEKMLRKRPYKEQLSVFAAGPFSNILITIVLVLIGSYFIFPFKDNSIEPNGIKITDYTREKCLKFPVENTGIAIGEVIQAIDNHPVLYFDNLSTIIKTKKPDDYIIIKTDKSSYEIKLARNPKNESQAYIGAYLGQSAKIKDNVKEKYGVFLPSFLIWLSGLLEMLIILNLGIGMFNLLPAGPLDGGRMYQLVMQKVFGKKNGDNVLKHTSLFLLVILLIYISIIIKNVILSILS